MSRVSLDDADIRILGILQEDATLSIANVAVKANMSQNACWRRIKRLEESGVIARRVTLLDAGALGGEQDLPEAIELPQCCQQLALIAGNVLPLKLLEDLRGNLRGRDQAAHLCDHRGIDHAAGKPNGS